METRWETRPWRPDGTYALLGIMVGIYLLEQMSLGVDSIAIYRHMGYPLPDWMFVISTDWFWRPWTLITSTLAHDLARPTHLLFNGLFLFFFGPTVERLIGVKRFLVLFFVSGAVAGVAQVELAGYLYGHGAALGASGALMALFGVLMLVVPNQTILIWGIIPVPMWLAGIGYAALDVLGAFNPSSGIGNFAHLAGLAIGLGYAIVLKRDWQRRGLRVLH